MTRSSTKTSIPATSKVVRVEPRADATQLLSFDGGEQGMFDVSPYFDKGIFTGLGDPNYLGQARPFFGTVGWPHGQDFSADTLSLEGQPVGETVL